MGYFQTIIVEDQRYELTHLDPFHFDFFSQRVQRQLRVHVTFSNHCFTTAWKGTTLDGENYLTDSGGRARVFCVTRYRLSLDLPAVVRTLNHPHAKVWETAQERNWCHALEIEDPSGAYYVFFEIRRAGKEASQKQDLNLFVESAYHQDPDRPRPALKGTIGFQLLCGKVFRHEPTSTRR